MTEASKDASAQTTGEHAGAQDVDTAAGEARHAASLRELGQRDPASALRRAQTEPQWRRRGIFVRAALRGWAATAADDAAAWVRANLLPGERHAAFTEIIAGAVANPPAAMRLAFDLGQSDPMNAALYGNAVVAELAKAGHYETAADVAARAPAANRGHWLSTAFFEWAQQQPADAIRAAGQFTDPAMREAAEIIALSGWASSDPATLVDHARGLPAGQVRAAALREGLRQWVGLDPIAAMRWMEQLAPGAELDAGAAAVAKLTDLVRGSPEVALTWANSITDLGQRSETVGEIVRQWAHRQPEAARQFAKQSAGLDPSERASVLADIQLPPEP